MSPCLKNSKIRNFIFCVLLFMAPSCANKKADHQFSQIVTDFVQEYFKTYPVTASLLGKHEFDGQLNSLNQSSINERTKKLFDFQKRLESLDSTVLSEQNLIDKLILMQEIEAEIWELKTLRIWETDITYYSELMNQAIAVIVNRSTDPPEQQCRYLYSRLGQFPRLFDELWANISQPSKRSLERALGQLTSLSYLLSSEVSRVAHNCPLLKDSLSVMNKSIIDSLKFLSHQLEKDMLLRGTIHSAVGTESYLPILQHRFHIDAEIDVLLAEAENEQQWCQQQIEQFAKDLHKIFFKKKADINFPSQMIASVLDKIQNNYLQDEELVDYTVKALDEIDQFLSIKGILNSDAEYEISVLRNPSWVTASDFVRADDPGPFELNQTYLYYISSPGDGTNWIDQMPFLRMLNQSMLQVLAIQYLIPGRAYVQTQFNNHPSLVRKIFQDHNFAEGWAFQAGFIMSDAGYGGYDKKIQFMHLIRYLQAIIAATVDIKYHTVRITESEAVNMLSSNYLNQSQAQEKFFEITLKPGQQISPFWSYVQIKNLYQIMRKLQVNFYSHSMFLDRCVSQGAVPLTILRKILLQEASQKTP